MEDWQGSSGSSVVDETKGDQQFQIPILSQKQNENSHNETQQSATTSEGNGAFIQKHNIENALNDFHGLRTWRSLGRMELI
jgi:hypothetical protein